MTRTIKHISAAILIAFAALLFQPQAYAAVAPLNPEYVKYIEQREKEQAALRSRAANSDEARIGGYVPSPLDWSHLAGRTWNLPQNGETQGVHKLARSAANSEEAIPTKYDLRAELPPMRNQTAFGNCWTHSAMAATESNLIKKGLADTSIDLSEWYLTYYAINPYGDMPGFSDGNADNYHLIGGNDWKAAALLSR